MIFGLFHKGSGLGDQLHRYVTVRTLAGKKGYQWGMWQPENFKGKSFMYIDYGEPVIEDAEYKQFREKEVREDGIDIRSYDPEINFVEDDTCIDGCFEDSKYWGSNLENIKDWLKVEPLEIPENKCVIGFRGGEYATDPDLFLPASYYREAIEKMLKINPDMNFEVHTDDKLLAQSLFNGYPVIQDIDVNWRSMRFAKYSIIANSAFYIMPRLLSGGHTIAPRYWARRNLKKWARPACYYDSFRYI